MTTALAEAQTEVRRAYLGGSVGQLYIGAVWLAAAAVWVLADPTPAIVLILVGGFFVYPVTTGVSRLLGASGTIPATNLLRPFGLTVPVVGALGLPLALAAALYRQEWFFPALMIVMGAHYLPFWPLYGMPVFAWLGAGMWAAGLVVAVWVPGAAAAAAALTGLALVLVGLDAARRHRAAARPAATRSPGYQ